MSENMKDQREGGFLIAKIHQLSNRIFNKMLKEHGLENFNSAQGRILFVLWREDNISINELSQQTQLSKTTLSTMLKTLEQRNKAYIKRVPSERDRREILVQLSKKGREIQSQYIDISRKMNELFYSSLTDKEIDEFEDYLRRLLDNLVNLS